MFISIFLLKSFYPFSKEERNPGDIDGLLNFLLWFVKNTLLAVPMSQVQCIKCEEDITLEANVMAEPPKALQHRPRIVAVKTCRSS